MSTLYEKTENLWQTLNAVRMLAATGKPLLASDMDSIKRALDENNPSEHMAETIVTFQGLREGQYVVKLERGGSPVKWFKINTPAKVTSNSPNQLLIKIP